MIFKRVCLLFVLLFLWGCEGERSPAAAPGATAGAGETAGETADATGLRDVSKEALTKDVYGKVEALPERLHPHWVWVADFAGSAMPDGRAWLYDGDTGGMLGMLNTGYSFNALNIPKHYREVYSAETYYSRTTRGQRTDVVSVYDPFKLSPVAEVEIPPKRASTIPRLADSALTDDDRFLSVFNLTPAASLSIVDVVERKFTAEIMTPGCAMTYAAGDRRFFALCGDGSLMMVTLTDAGTQAAIEKSAPFFNAQKDPILETGARLGDAWLFVSVLGKIHIVDLAGEQPAFSEPWSYLTAAEREANWRAGGMQPLALHEANQHLYLLMRQGDFFSYEDPGPEIWVYDLKTRKQLRKIKTRQPSLSIAVSQDEAPLLYAITESLNQLDIYDGAGQHLRSVSELGIMAALIQPPPLQGQGE